MSDSAHYEQLARQNRELHTENARLHRLLADAEDELAERRAHQRREDHLTAAWQSTIVEARRQAARADAAEARLTELEEDEGDWMSGMLYARKMSIVWGEPIISPAFTGDTAQPIDQAEPVTLTARHLSYQRPACPGCEWAAHPPLTCDEVAAFRDRFDSLLAEGLKEIQEGTAAGAEMVATDMSLFLASQAAEVHRARMQAEADYVENSLLFGPTVSIPEAANPAMSWNSFLSDMERAWRREDAEKMWAGVLGAAPAESPTPVEGLTVITTDPVQEIAADAATVEQLRRQLPGVPASRLGAQVGQIGQFSGFPVIVDPDLPPGEVHMRPHPKSAEVHESHIWEDEGEWKVSCDACPAYVDNIGSEDDADQWAQEHYANPDQL